MPGVLLFPNHSFNCVLVTKRSLSLVLKNKCLDFEGLFNLGAKVLGLGWFFRTYVSPTRRAIPQKAEKGFQRISWMSLAPFLQDRGVSVCLQMAYSWWSFLSSAVIEERVVRKQINKKGHCTLWKLETSSLITYACVQQKIIVSSEHGRPFMKGKALFCLIFLAMVCLPNCERSNIRYKMTESTWL